MSDIEILKPLIDKVLSLSVRESEGQKRALWAEHQALNPVSRVPVTVYYEGIPFPQWDMMLGKGHAKCQGELAKGIEFDLRCRIWTAENICDDHIVWPSIVINMPMAKRRDWGVDIKWTESRDELGAKAYDPPFHDGIDIDRLTVPICEFDEETVSRTLAEAQGLTGGALKVFPNYPDMGFAPFDTATQMRGMENLMLDVALEPERVAALMDFITSAMETHEIRRGERGWVNVFPDSEGKYQQIGWRVNCAYLSDDFKGRRPRLSDEWVYISAQTSAGLGPRDYGRFAYPYVERLARLFPEKTVYYHGCECLDEKMELLAELPNLRRFHVSPWTSLEKARDKFQGRVVLEVHDHPGKVFFGSAPDETRSRIRRILTQAQGHPMDLNLSDIHSINNDPSLLTQWAQIAREEIDRLSG